MLPPNACALARWIAAADDRLVRFCTAVRRAEPDCTGLQRAEGLPLVRGFEAIAAFYPLPSSLGQALTYLRDQPAVRRREPELFSAVNEAVTRTLGTVQSDLQLLVWPEGLPKRPPASPWARRPFRGVLSAALLLAGLGSIPTPPPREPEPDQREFDAMLAKLAEAGVDGPALLEQCGGFRHEFMRRGLIELAARDLARQGVYDIASARDILDHMSQMPDDTRISMFERLGPPKKPIPVALPISGKGRVGVLEVRGRRGPGRQLRDERERVGEPLRILAAYTGLTTVELGEIERGLRVPTPEQWEALQVALPGLGPMEAPPTEAERRPTIPAEVVDAALHPAGRCTCGGGGTGDCEWCVMDQRRELREARLRDYGRTLREFRDGLLLGSLSTLTPGQRLEEARRQLDAVASKARTGDQNAQGQVQGLVSAFLEASATYNASGAGFTSDFAYTQQLLTDLSTSALAGADVAQLQLDALGVLNQSVLTIPAALTNLTGAITTAIGAGLNPGAASIGALAGGVTGERIKTEAGSVYASASGASSLGNTVYTKNGKTFTLQELQNELIKAIMGGATSQDFATASAITGINRADALAALAGTGYESRLPAFRNGGTHAGGWAMVGEAGPELAYMPPARIYSNGDTRQMLDIAPLKAEIRELRGTVEQLGRALVAATYDATDRAAGKTVDGVAGASSRASFAAQTAPVLA